MLRVVGIVLFGLGTAAAALAVVITMRRQPESAPATKAPAAVPRAPAKYSPVTCPNCLIPTR